MPQGLKNTEHFEIIASKYLLDEHVLISQFSYSV